MRGFLILATVLLAVPFSGSAYATNVAIIVMLHAMAAIGLALLMGYTGQISLGHSAFYGLGAYGSAILTVKLGINGWLAIPIALSATGLICYGLGWIIFRLRGHHLAVATLGVAIIVYVAFVELRQWTGGPNGLTGIKPLALFGFAFEGDERFFVLAYLAFLGVVWVAMNLVSSPIGLAMRGIAESERAAASLGTDVAALKRKILVLSGVLAALGGSLYAYYIGFVSPQPFSVVFSIKLLLMCAIGGFRNVIGVVLGVAFITVITEPLQDLGYYDVVVFGVLLAVCMLIFPDGLPAGIMRLIRRARPRRLAQ
ncbi:MAG: branched-chain amino acid ABC transporter permease [Burkholderiales bacterium]